MASTVCNPEEVAGFAQHVLKQGGPHTTAGATNIVFQHVTGIDPYDLTDILVHDAPIASDVSARYLREVVAKLLDIRLVDAGTLLGASESRFSRNNSIDREMLDRIYAILDTWLAVAAALGPKNTARWFGTPHAALDGEAPARLFTTNYGRNLVRDLISALHSGSYV